MENLEKFSYSKLGVYHQCKYRYKLVYVDKCFIDQPNIATEFGTLIHFIEESIGLDIINNKPLDYNKYIDLFLNVCNDNDKLYGINHLKERHPKDFYKADKSGLTYEEKANNYINEGISRLEDYLLENPELEIIDVEKEFSIVYDGIIFHGAIDRILRNKITKELIVEDVKTYSKPIKDTELKTPLQFVIYALACEQLYGTYPSKCFYDLPICCIRQQAGTTNFITRGLKQIEKLLTSIHEQDFEPIASALCYYCPFSKTNPNQPEAGKNKCPYYSLWTPDNKIRTVNHEWLGPENHEAILKAFVEKEQLQELKLQSIKINDPIEIKSERRYLLRK